MYFLATILFVGFYFCETPANCDKKQIVGNWKFQIEAPSPDAEINCMSHGIIAPNSTIHISLEEPNIAKADNGVIGTWTMIEVEGFSIYLGDQHYFALFQYVETEDESGQTIYINYCNQSRGGWSNKDVIKPQNYSCFVATKDSSSQKHSHQSTLLSQVVRIRQQDSDGVRQQSKDYEKIVTPVQPVPSDPRHIAQFPSSLDWSNYSNFDYVEPVSNQGECGSCYAFATLGMMEARYSLALNKTVDVSLSVQDIVSCSYYTQGCFGGHGSTASQWMRDHGIVSEKCFPYQQIEQFDPEVKCSTKLCSEAGIDKDRHTFYAQNIRYVGGFYGNCSEEAMIRELQQGPIEVSIYSDFNEFNNYKGGLFDYDYTHPQHSDHIVVLVGYGYDELRNPITGEKITQPFWKIKNSFGREWGENGFMRLIRGKNLLNIESEAEVADPYIIPGLYWPDVSKLKKKERSIITAVILLSVLTFVLLMSTVILGVYACRQIKTKTGYKSVVSSDGTYQAGQFESN